MVRKRKVIVLYGGRSTEHEVSCRSAAFVLRHLDPAKYDIQAVAIDQSGAWLPQDTSALLATTNESVPIVSRQAKSEVEVVAASDEQTPVVFPVIHGTGGEDGSLQGFLDLCGVAYVGADTTGAAVGMDKVLTKTVVAAAGLKVVPHCLLRLQDWAKVAEGFLDECVATLGFPMFVKPTRLGSSVGISKAKTREELRAACELALRYDERLMVEQGLEVREWECAVLGDYTPEASVVGELVMNTAEFYDYEAKYISESGAEIVIPAKISKEQSEAVRTQAIQAFKALGLYGMARMDFFWDTRAETLYFNEVNTVPGLTAISQFPLLWQESGMEPGALLDRLIALAVERRSMQDQLQRQL